MSASNAQHERQETARRFTVSPGKMVESARETIVEHAVPSVALCFGLGFGAGLVIGLALAESMRPDERTTAERYGRQFLDAIYRVMPQSLGGRA
jgi:hypothetical protein